MNNICILPWISLETSPLGEIRACCMNTRSLTKNGKHISLSDTTLSKAFNSDDMVELRSAFIRGEKPSSCNRCWNEEAAGRISKRQNSWYRLKHLVTDIDFTRSDDGKLLFLDLKLGNICNLKCRICGSFSSSKWAQEELDIYPDNTTARQNLKLGRWPRESAEFWDDLNSYISNIRYMEFTGGEPFLIDEHFDLLQCAVDNGLAKDIEIHYNTNGTTFPQRGLELWQHFKLVEIALSIDDIGQRFEYQRYGANWDVVQNNLQKFRELRKNSNNIKLQLCLTVNVFNIWNLKEICKWIPKQKFNFVYFNVLHDAWYFSIRSLPVTAKEKVTNLYKNYNGAYNKDVFGLLQFMNQGKSSDGTDLLRVISESDIQRKQHLRNVIPELAGVLKYE